jgi:hypothetical protein
MNIRMIHRFQTPAVSQKSRKGTCSLSGVVTQGRLPIAEL